MGVQSLQKTWKNNEAISLCIPKAVQVALNIEAGDVVQVTWEKVIKLTEEEKAKFGQRSKRKIKKEELPEL